MSDYAVAAGFVQFDPETKDVNGQEITEVVVRAAGSQKLVKITLWPEFSEVAATIEKGDWVAADGKFTQSLGQAKNGEQREYYSISAFHLVVTPGERKAEREVVQKVAKPKATDSPAF